MSDRTTFEIIEAVKNGERPDYDDLRFALLVLEGLATFDRTALIRLAEAENDGRPKIITRSAAWQWEESFKRSKRAMQEPPRRWVGESNDPDNPAYRERRRVALKLVDVAIQRVKERA